MKFRFVHNNINVFDLDKSIAFYKEALGLEVVRESGPDDGSFKLAFLEDSTGGHQLELTWLKEWDRPYNLGDNEIHIAFKVDDYEAAHAHHKAMDCICFENDAMGLYFINDPDGYWIEIIPEVR